MNPCEAVGVLVTPFTIPPTTCLFPMAAIPKIILATVSNEMIPDSVSKSNVVAYVNESTVGLPTVRELGHVERLVVEPAELAVSTQTDIYTIAYTTSDGDLLEPVPVEPEAAFVMEEKCVPIEDMATIHCWDHLIADTASMTSSSTPSSSSSTLTTDIDDAERISCSDPEISIVIVERDCDDTAASARAGGSPTTVPTDSNMSSTMVDHAGIEMSKGMAEECTDERTRSLDCPVEMMDAVSSDHQTSTKEEACIAAEPENDGTTSDVNIVNGNESIVTEGNDNVSLACHKVTGNEEEHVTGEHMTEEGASSDHEPMTAAVIEEDMDENDGSKTADGHEMMRDEEQEDNNSACLEHEMSGSKEVHIIEVRNSYFEVIGNDESREESYACLNNEKEEHITEERNSYLPANEMTGNDESREESSTHRDNEKEEHVTEEKDNSTFPDHETAVNEECPIPEESKSSLSNEETSDGCFLITDGNTSYEHETTGDNEAVKSDNIDFDCVIIGNELELENDVVCVEEIQENEELFTEWESKDQEENNGSNLTCQDSEEEIVQMTNDIGEHVRENIHQRIGGNEGSSHIEEEEAMAEANSGITNLEYLGNEECIIVECTTSDLMIPLSEATVDSTAATMNDENTANLSTSSEKFPPPVSPGKVMHNSTSELSSPIAHQPAVLQASPCNKLSFPKSPMIRLVRTTPITSPSSHKVASANNNVMPYSCASDEACLRPKRKWNKRKWNSGVEYNIVTRTNVRRRLLRPNEKTALPDKMTSLSPKSIDTSCIQKDCFIRLSSSPILQKSQNLLKVRSNTKSPLSPQICIKKVDDIAFFTKQRTEIGTCQVQSLSPATAASTPDTSQELLPRTCVVASPSSPTSCNAKRKYMLRSNMAPAATKHYNTCLLSLKYLNGQPKQVGGTKSGATSLSAKDEGPSSSGYSGAVAAEGKERGEKRKNSMSSDGRRTRKHRRWRSDEETVSVKLSCALCGLGNNVRDLSYLYGPYSVECRTEEVWVHNNCAVWAPGVCLDGDELKGLNEAIEGGENLTCAKCKSPGATIVCHLHSCKQPFHYPCAVEEGCRFNFNQFTVTCPNHSSLDL